MGPMFVVTAECISCPISADFLVSLTALGVENHCRRAEQQAPSSFKVESAPTPALALAFPRRIDDPPIASQRSSK